MKLKAWLRSWLGITQIADQQVLERMQPVWLPPQRVVDKSRFIEVTGPTGKAMVNAAAIAWLESTQDGCRIWLIGITQVRTVAQSYEDLRRQLSDVSAGV